MRSVRSVEFQSMRLKHLQTHLLLADRFNIDKDECQGLIKAIDKRKQFKSAIPSIVGLIVIFAWMVLYGRGTDALEGTRWDILSFLFDIGPVGIILAIFSGLGIGTLLAASTAIALRRRFLSQQFNYHLFTPACFWCGYSLKGHDCDGNYIKCPECGKRSRTGS